MEPQPLLSAPAKSLSKRVTAWSKQRRYPDAYGLQGRNLLLLVIVVMAISFLSAFFLREWISGVAVSVAIVGATFLLGRKAYIDNSHVFITQPHWPKAAVAIALGRSASTVKDCSSSGGLGGALKSRHRPNCRERPQLSPDQPFVNRPTLAEVPLTGLSL